MQTIFYSRQKIANKSDIARNTLLGKIILIYTSMYGVVTIVSSHYATNYSEALV